MFSGICQKPKIQNSIINYSRVFCTAKQTTDPVKNSNNFVFKPPEEKDEQQQQPHPEDVEHVGKLFPTPKQTLNNIFDAVSAELHNKELRVTATFKRIKHNKTSYNWMCTYNVKWPESKTFTQIATTKQEASRKASLMVLSWLKQLHKITHDGKPIVLGKEDIQKLRDTPFNLKLNEMTEAKLREVVHKYDEYLAKHFEDISEQSATSGVSVELQKLENMRIPFQQRFEGTANYLRKTNVELPITKFQNEIIELSKNNNVVIIKGEPGCGKSTQVPQFILENWAVDGGPNEQPCRIVVSQPRRIAAISLASRVAAEKMDEVPKIITQLNLLKKELVYRKKSITISFLIS